MFQLEKTIHAAPVQWSAWKHYIHCFSLC